MNDEEMQKWLIEAMNKTVTPSAFKVPNDHGIYGDFGNARTASNINEDRQRIERLERELNEKRHQVHEAKQELLELKLNITSEQLLREKHPGLKELYDEYVAMLNLVKEY